jgi:quercetin dioxygenase-like cupin family protein
MKGNDMETQMTGSNGAPLFDITGTVLQFLVTPAEISEAFAMMRGIVSPGVVVPLHSHADPEVLFILEGELEVFKGDDGSIRWRTARSGETICIPSDVKHALRNNSPTPAAVLLTTTPNIYRFFRELGKPFYPDQPAVQPTPADLERLRTLAARHNYWMASPEENAAIGLSGF